MNRRMIFYTVARIVSVEAVLLLIPALVCLIYGETSGWAFLFCAVCAGAIGVGVTALSRPRTHVIYAKEGFLIVALSWVAMSLIGAVPFTLGGEIPSFTDAFFETVSGFTTTGASILTDVESLGKGALFWRSFSHWIGGMGVIVFVTAVLPSVSDRSIHILRAEMPGPIVGKLVPKARDTAKILYLIYVVLTAILAIFLLAGGMTPFDSLLHAFGTAGTGGFGIKADSLASYSPYLQWVITVFMFLFGINFNLYYLILIGRWRGALRSTELRFYAVLSAVCTGVICADLTVSGGKFGESLRAAAFQVVSIVTTTGYATADYTAWSSLSKTILFLLLFTGACAGSTSGGLKLSRVILLFRQLKREIRRLIHPRSVSAVRFEGQAVDDATLSSVSLYFVLYIVCIFLTFFLLCFEKTDAVTNFSAAVSCFNNVGPGFAAVGPAGSYAVFSPFAKWVLSAAMLLGRLEIFPLLIAAVPSSWSRR